jgi:AraC-like DNA-binding protein
MISPTLHKLPVSSNSSFVYQQWDCDNFDKPWHYHKEYELVLINQGKGMRFIGDNVSLFQENDLAFIGSDIPHLYRNNAEYYCDKEAPKCRSTFIHFTKEFLGNAFFQVPEMVLVRRLLDRSSLALEVQGAAKKYTIEKLKGMYEQSSADRLLSLLEILINLSESHELKPLLSSGYTVNNTGDTEKINNAFEFILKNYGEKIYEKDIASKLNMSTASFSRYFKQHTRKTFSDYVTEIRIGQACRLLMENNYGISEICYLCGFENLSNFYRHFKRIVGIIPREYRKRFLKASPTPRLYKA